MTAYDLDHLLEELDGKGDTVTLFGEEWTLPSDVDAETMLRVQRLQMKLALAKRSNREVKPEDVVDDGIELDRLVESMAGADNFAAWRERGLGYRAMQMVAGKLYAIHSGEGESRGKGQSSGPGKRTQKSTGTSRSTRRTTPQE